MPLSVGDKLGPYEILAPIGAGGMGEVYRAKDTKLKRDVAIKVLPAALAHDPERLARFEREARLLASLDHPNIGAIYGLEESAGTRALILALVEGPTLADRIAAGPIPLEEVIHIAQQMADALEYAHDRGVIHRDLKPANVKITPEGTVKVLDFGLAKALTAESDASSRSSANSPTMSPTLTMRATQAGMILGTAAYMAPEQAKGKTVDRRADIWAFGVVLFEMLTGEQLFTGDTAAEIIASTIKEEPKLERLPTSTPPVIRQLIERCLNKDPKQRLQAIGEARIAIQKFLANPTSVPDEQAPPLAKTRFGWSGWAVAMVAIVIAAALAFVHFRENPPIQQSIRFQIPPPEKAAFGAFKLSQDGRYLAFVASNRLWVRALDSLQSQPLTGTDGANNPFWSPDDRFIGFFAQGKLKKIAATGGPAQILSDAPNGRGGAWNADGTIVFTPAAGGGPLYAVSAGGGAATPLTGTEHGEYPDFLPTGRRFLYTCVTSTPEANGIYAASLNGTAPVRILPDVSNAAYVSTAAHGESGHVVFRRGSTLMAQPFDPNQLRLTGEVFPLAEQVGELTIGVAAFSASGNDTLAFGPGGSGIEQLAWVDRSGKQKEPAGPPASYRRFRLSPDDKRIAMDRTDAQSNSDIWVLDLARLAASRLTFDPGAENNAVWSPDGLRVVYASARSGRSGGYDLYVKSANGAGQEQLLVKAGTPNLWPTDWSRDGRFILYNVPSGKTKQDLWIVPQWGDRKPFPYLQSEFNEQNGTFSPDGRWVAYDSDESGREEIYVQSFPVSGAKFQISTDGGSEPRWRSDGTELFYVAADRNLMAVPVKLNKHPSQPASSQPSPSPPSFEAGLPKPLFPVPATGFRTSYAPAYNGQRFLILTPAEGDGGAVSPITVFTNWQEVLKK